MSPQILTLKLDGITAGDYLTWCRDPDPPALDFALRSISVDADPLGDTITAILDWNQPPPPPSAAAAAAGLPLPAGAELHLVTPADLRVADLEFPDSSVQAGEEPPPSRHAPHGTRSPLKRRAAGIWGPRRGRSPAVQPIPTDSLHEHAPSRSDCPR
jgi:hypothetical protein